MGGRNPSGPQTLQTPPTTCSASATQPTLGPAADARRPGWSGRVEGPRQWGPPPGDPAGAPRPSPLSRAPSQERAPGLSVSELARSVPTPTFFDAPRQLKSGLARSCRKPTRGLPQGASSPLETAARRHHSRRRGPLRPRRRRMGSVDRWPLAKPTIEHLETTPTAMARRLLGALAAAAGASALGRQVSQRPSPPRTEGGKRATARPKRPW